MRQIISAVKYLHDKRIIHRYITLDNILFHYDSEEDQNNKNLIKSKIKIIDFGFARYLKKGELAYSTVVDMSMKMESLTIPQSKI